MFSISKQKRISILEIFDIEVKRRYLIQNLSKIKAKRTIRPKLLRIEEETCKTNPKSLESKQSKRSSVQNFARSKGIIPEKYWIEEEQIELFQNFEDRRKNEKN